MPLLPENSDNWVKSAKLVSVFNSHNKEYAKSTLFSDKYLPFFEESMTSESKGRYEVFAYRIKHKSGWMYTHEFLKMRGVLDQPVFLEAINPEGKLGIFWYYRKQLEMFSDFNKLFC